MNFNRNHPECPPGFCFISNVTYDTFKRSSLFSKRLGVKAYDNKDVLIEQRADSDDKLFPMFALKFEVEANLSRSHKGDE